MFLTESDVKKNCFPAWFNQVRLSVSQLISFKKDQRRTWHNITHLTSSQSFFNHILYRKGWNYLTQQVHEITKIRQNQKKKHYYVPCFRTCWLKRHGTPQSYQRIIHPSHHQQQTTWCHRVKIIICIQCACVLVFL